MLEVASKAPDFTLPDQNENTLTLSSLKGKWVVLYFYPKDDTSGCTTEACNFQSLLPDFSNIDAEIIGVSKDPVKKHKVKKHKKFADKYNLKFTLLSDENGTVCEDYGTWVKKSMYGREYMGIQRSTYLIDPNGKIAKVYPKVKPKEHHTEVLADLNELK
jgi:peroxiredoxin Q/BCP